MLYKHCLKEIIFGTVLIPENHCSIALTLTLLTGYAMQWLANDFNGISLQNLGLQYLDGQQGSRPAPTSLRPL